MKSWVKSSAKGWVKSWVKSWVKRWVKSWEKTQLEIILEIINDSQISIVELSQRMGISTTAIENNITKLKEKGILQRIGPDKSGYWEVDQEFANILNRT